MSGSAVLTFVAVVLSVGDGSVTVGGEALELLRPGDHGQIYYELTVGPEARRIDVGAAEVVAVERERAVLAMSSGADRVQAGHSVALTVPYERVHYDLASARERLGALELELAEARGEATSAGTATDDTETTEAVLRQRLEALQQTANETAAERHELTRRLRAATAEHDELRDTLRRLESRNAELQLEVEALVFVLGQTLAESSE